MAVTYVEIEDRYKPKTAEEPIEVSVIIGDGQSGGYLIFLEQKLKASNKAAKLGRARDVVEKRTIVSATVVDEMDETNWTSVTVVITEGSTQTRYGPYSKQAAQNLDTICYLIKILNTYGM